MKKKLLSIGMPSNRKLAQCRTSIESAMEFCRRHDAQLSISDNSGDAEKAVALPEILGDNGVAYAQRPPCGATENWLAAFDGTEGEFVLMMGDDDSVLSLGDLPDFANLPPDVVGIKPNIIAYAAPTGITRVSSNSIQGNTGIERVTEYAKTAQGMNIGICSFWRRDVFKALMDLHFHAHPTRGAYCDWALMHALVSSGKILRAPMSCYFYDIKNWVGNEEALRNQTEKTYMGSGLPAGSSDYSRVLNGIDTFIYVNRTASPLGAEEKLKTALFCFNMYLAGHAQAIPRKSTHAHVAELNTLSARLAGNKDIHSLFDIVLNMLAALRPGLDAEYKVFYERATGFAWGQVER